LNITVGIEVPAPYEHIVDHDDRFSCIAYGMLVEGSDPVGVLVDPLQVFRVVLAPVYVRFVLEVEVISYGVELFVTWIL
jgi:hypothetical protein